MKVLMISSSYPRNAQDWRGRFMNDLVCALAQKETIQLHLWAPPGEKPPTVFNAVNESDGIWLRQLLDQGGIAHVLRKKNIRSLFQALALLSKIRKAYLAHSDADVIHVNWLQNALPLWRTNKPAVISILGSDYALLRLPFMISLLRTVIRQRRCILAPNADWMVEKLNQYFGDLSEIRPVPFGIRDVWFDLKRNQTERKTRKWIVISRVTKKKIGPLFSWGETIFRNDEELHLLGPMQEQMDIPSWVHYHGATHPEAISAKWFPEATALITLSEHDEGRPQVMLEAMAAKVPIIASDLPAHRNMINHRETGWIARTKEELTEGMNWLADRENNSRIGSEASAWAKNNVGTWDDCAQRYLDTYQKLTGMGK